MKFKVEKKPDYEGYQITCTYCAKDGKDYEYSRIFEDAESISFETLRGFFDDVQHAFGIINK